MFYVFVIKVNDVLFDESFDFREVLKNLLESCLSECLAMDVSLGVVYKLGGVIKYAIEAPDYTIVFINYTEFLLLV
jgi:hypothetical protein